jgi:hypothetical protein
MQGFNIAEAGHVAVILPPKSISGGSGLINPAFSMKNYKHATILIASGANAMAIPFNYYFQALGGAGNDVLGAVQNAPAAGITPGGGQLASKRTHRHRN